MSEIDEREQDRNSDFDEEIREEKLLKIMQAEEEYITRRWYE